MATDLQASFQTIRDTLRVCRGEAQAVTIEDLARRCCICRRECEELLETRLADLPFPVAAGAHGYFVPVSADEINRYVQSLRSRAVKIFLRQRTVIRLAQRAGWPRQGKTFANPPSEQGELFMMSRITASMATASAVDARPGNAEERPLRSGPESETTTPASGLVREPNGLANTGTISGV